MPEPIKEIRKERDRCTGNFLDEIIQWIRDDINEGEWMIGTETRVLNIRKSEQFSPCAGDIIRCYGEREAKGKDSIHGVDIIRIFEVFYNL